MNPQIKKEDTIFDSFCFVPETKAEEDLGYLYLIGELKNALPKKNEDLLTNLAEIIKQKYYKLPLESPGDNFKQSLEKANEFLAQEIKKENVSWLGNLNFAVVSLTPDFLINFSKVGNLKILLLRNKEIFDIGEQINSVPSPAKTFPNVVEGKLEKGDKILLLTQEPFEVFKKEEILQNLTDIKKPRKIKKIFKEKKKILKEIFGACLLIIPEKKGILTRKIYLPKILPSVNLRGPFKIFNFPQKIFSQSPVLQEKFKKASLAILILIIVLVLGWLIFR
ncbi:hypothetical protein J7K42_02005 [bacterium]|nr:hypothetical protein [bacterium]